MQKIHPWFVYCKQGPIHLYSLVHPVVTFTMYRLFVIEFCSQTINSYASISRLKKQTKNNVIPVFIKVPSTWIEKCVKFSILLIQSSLIKQVHPPAVPSVSALPQCWSSMCSKRSGDSPDHQYPTSESGFSSPLFPPHCCQL